MLFNSIEFLIFFPIVAVIYFIFPDRFKYLWLLAASYYFYMCWNAQYALLILFSTAVTWVSGLLIERVKQSQASGACQTSRKKIIVAVCITLNLSVLFLFKYLEFALSLFGSALSLIHIELTIPTFDFLLPVGISFYTFQALGYTIDIYRDEIHAENNFFRYALFVSFFPQLVAGPIERSQNLLHQLAVPHKFDWYRFKDGALLMLWGFFLKVVLADRIALFVDTVYGDIYTYTGWYLIIATILFAVQVYCDFYGYSVIAKGTAEILGIQLMENFNAPFLSLSIAELWQRWHISLTSWFRDYLYIPLGGNRRGTIRKYLNKMIVVLASGLWHGASTTYIIWGALNGIYQIAGELLRPVRDKLIDLLGLHRESFGHKLLCCLFTLILFDFSLIFFRADTLREAFAVVIGILTVSNPWILFDGSLFTCGLDNVNFILTIFCILILMWADVEKHRGIVVRAAILRQDVWFQCAAVIFFIMAILIFGLWGPGYNASNFIYFQF